MTKLTDWEEALAAQKEQKENAKREMDQGARAADFQWDEKLNRQTKGFLVGYQVRFFALYAAATTPEESAAFFDAIGKGIAALGIGRPNQRKN